jgi:ABC-type phosphate transport system permease subunit
MSLRKANKKIRKRKAINNMVKRMGLFCSLVVIFLVGMVVVSTLVKAVKAFTIPAINLPVSISFKDDILHYCVKEGNNNVCYMPSGKDGKGKSTKVLERQLSYIVNISLKNHLQEFCQDGIMNKYFSVCNPKTLKNEIFAIDLSRQIKDQVKDFVSKLSTNKLYVYNKTCLFSGVERDLCEINRLNFSLRSSYNFYMANDSNFSAKELKTIKSDKNSISNLLFYYADYVKNNSMYSSVYDFRVLTNTNSIYPDFAGIKDSIYGTLMTVVICLIFSFPISVLAALFIEEFWRRKFLFLKRIIVISIDNMSAIPSIIYGLLGAVLYINILHFPRSSILVGGFTLSFIAFPLMVIASRNAIMNVPEEVKNLARVMGASDYYIGLRHTLPMAMNGIITGTVLTVGRIAGETACLLVVGLTAFNSEIPSSVLDKTSTIATQVYTWLEMPDRGFMFRIYAGMGIIIFISFSVALLIRLIRSFKKS